ncbi:hypothetical protein HPP92_026144 [Vanilla planifolia]|uniref:Uncharacterized protein n=1 Tax=Vanilla planifolia TaxID=51239 RepID=A0A835PDB0_VANPL|nr:hypothetical protein HPP92_026144 [Vanilla planifolia]
MSEGHKVEELCQKCAVIDITLNYEDTRVREESLAGTLQGRFVVIIEVVKAHHPITTSSESIAHMRADEASSAGNEDRNAKGTTPDAGRGAYTLLPLGTSPGGSGRGTEEAAFRGEGRMRETRGRRG